MAVQMPKSPQQKAGLMKSKQSAWVLGERIGGNSIRQGRELISRKPRTLKRQRNMEGSIRDRKRKVHLQGLQGNQISEGQVHQMQNTSIETNIYKQNHQGYQAYVHLLMVGKQHFSHIITFFIKVRTFPQTSAQQTSGIKLLCLGFEVYVT